MDKDMVFGQQEELKDEFKVVDLSSATWTMRKLKEIADKKAEIKAVADTEIERINKWQEEELKYHEDNREYFEGLLSVYYVEQKKTDKKFTLKTPYGKVTSRCISKWLYEDEEKLMEYLEAEDTRAIRIKKEIDKTYLKGNFKDAVNKNTGELLPGVRIEETESITIKAE